MRIAIIPARSGSKRIPNKNIRNFYGIPMLVRTINLLKDSELFYRIIVSTNDANYAKIAIDAGACVDHLRPGELSSDSVGLREVMKFELSKYGNKLDPHCEIMCVLPCTPLLNVITLKRSIETFAPSSFDLLFPVIKNSKQSQRSFQISDNGLLNPLTFDNNLRLTQDLELTFQDAGQFYLSTASNWSSGKLDAMQGLIVSKTSAVDVDDEEDWILAEALFKHQNDF
jgi:pseudaminic acid cytidylyltransferase